MTKKVSLIKTFIFVVSPSAEIVLRVEVLVQNEETTFRKYTFKGS